MRHQTLEFEVQDTGIGISHADLLRLFSPFVQSDASTTRTHGGMGVMVVLPFDLVPLSVLGKRLCAMLFLVLTLSQ